MSTYAAKGIVQFGSRHATEGVGGNDPGKAAELTLKIREVRASTPRTRIIRLELAGSQFDYQPGQAVFVGPKNAKSALFSLTLSPEESRQSGCLEILSRVDQPDSTLIDTASGVVQVAGPVGQFTLPNGLSARARLVFIAGGTGIAPLRSMLRRAMHLPISEIDLLYSARAPEEFPYEDELRALAQDGRIKLWQTVTRDDNINGWLGARGRIGASVLTPLASDPDTIFFICGPLGMVTASQRLLGGLGVAPERIRTDRW